MFEVHISKHSLFRLKITVGCLTSTYPSIHKNSQDHGRLSEVLWCVVCGVLWVQEGVVLCDELCVVLFGVLRGGVVWCVVCGCFISLFLSLSLFLSFSLSLNSLLSLSRSLSLSFLFFPSSVSSSSFSSLFPSRQQTLCKALINKRNVQL